MKEIVCYFCKESILTEDDFCPGCNNYVCTNCDNLCMLGPHEIQDHIDDSSFEWDGTK